MAKILLSALILLAFTCLISPVHSYDKDEDSGSLTLTELNFHQAIKEFKMVLVNFHALWCRYSKRLKPEWKNLAKTIDTRYPQVKTAKVEAYDEKKLAEEYGVEGYPTIKLFIDQKPVDYVGERTEEGILEFVKRQLKQPLNVVNDVKDIEKKQKEYEWIAMLIGSSEEDTVKEVAAKHGEVYFVKTSNSDVKSKYGDPQDGNVVLVRNISSDYKIHKNRITEKGLEEFIQDNYFEPIAKFSKGTAERIFLNEDPAMILIKKDDEAGKAAYEQYKLANTKIGDKIFMSVANYEDSISMLLTQNLGIDESELPTVRIVRADRERIRKYKIGEKITADNIKSFYEDYTEGRARRTYLSEPIPTEQKDLVKKVVTKNYQELVLDRNTDVLLLIWAPWCGHCRSMMPVYDNVARKTRLVNNFIVAKVDASVNDLEGFGLDIVEYPTILLFTRGDKENPIEFKGDRNEYAFNDWIRHHASVDLGLMKGPDPFNRNEL